MIGLIDVESVLSAYDLRYGMMEIRRKMFTDKPAYLLTMNGTCVMTSFRLSPIWDVITAEIQPDRLEVVSCDDSQRSRRYTRPVYIWEEVAQTYDDIDEALHDAVIRREREEGEEEQSAALTVCYEREKETVCDILPDYHVSLGDLIDEDRIEQLEEDFLFTEGRSPMDSEVEDMRDRLSTP